MTDPTTDMFDEPPPATKTNNLWNPSDYDDWIRFCEQYQGNEFQFVFGRDYRTLLRDGANRTFSQDMIKQLGRMMTIFTLTRINKEWKASGKAPQRMRVRFSVELSDRPADLEDGEDWTDFDYGNPL